LKEEYAYNPTAAKKLLADAGYPTGFKTNVVADTAVDLDLLKIVKSYLSQVGIDMEIRLMDSAAWSDFVLLGHKHDQMSQRPAAGSRLCIRADQAAARTSDGTPHSSNDQRPRL